MLGERIRARRKALRVSRRCLAQAVGVDPVTIWRIERGLRTPRVDLLCRLAKALRLRPEELLKGGT